MWMKVSFFRRTVFATALFVTISNIQRYDSHVLFDLRLIELHHKTISQNKVLDLCINNNFLKVAVLRRKESYNTLNVIKW